MKYVVIGTGVAGIAAIEAIRSIDTLGAITLIGDDPHGYYSRPGLAYYLSGEINDKLLFPQIADEFRKFHVHSVKGLVERITPASHRVYLQNGSSSSTTDCSWQPEPMPQHCPSLVQHYPGWLNSITWKMRARS